MIVLLDAENRRIVFSFVWTKHRNVTDGRTDKRTRQPITAITTACIASNDDARKTVDQTLQRVTISALRFFRSAAGKRTHEKHE